MLMNTYIIGCFSSVSDFLSIIVFRCLEKALTFPLLFCAMHLYKTNYRYQNDSHAQQGEND